MLEQAEKQFGFEPDDSTLMVEAVPQTNGNLILTITKSEDAGAHGRGAERFQQEGVVSTPLTATETSENIEAAENRRSQEENNDEPLQSSDELPFDDETIGAALQSMLGEGIHHKNAENFTSLPDYLNPAGKKTTSSSENSSAIRIYAFDSFEPLTEAARAVRDLFDGDNAVYHDPATNRYFLIIKRDSANKDSYDQSVSVLYEYAKPLKCNYATTAYIKEHLEPVISSDAIAILNVI